LSEEYDEEVVEWLKRSRELVGELEPVLITPEGEIIDGKHRLKAYPGWPTKILQVDELRKVVERVHRNIHRKITKKETKEAVIQLALALERQGTPKEFIIDEIKKYLPFSEDYIRQYLPSRFKREYKKPEKLPVKIFKPKLVQAPSKTPEEIALERFKEVGKHYPTIIVGYVASKYTGKYLEDVLKAIFWLLWQKLDETSRENITAEAIKMAGEKGFEQPIIG